MLTRGVYCAACGGPVRRDVLDITIPDGNEDAKSLHWTYDGTKIPVEDTEWLSKFRLLGPKNSVPVQEPSPASPSSHHKTASPCSPVSPDSLETQLTQSPIPSTFTTSQPQNNNGGEATEVVVSLPAQWVDWTEVCFPSSDEPEKLYTVYAASDFYVKRDFLVPVHEACLDLVQCVAPNVGRDSFASESPATTASFMSTCKEEAFARFYNCLKKRRQQNVREEMVFPTYASAGGIEWSHGYYGARGFWGQGWICKRGAEHVVANPFHVPEITDYIYSRLKSLDAEALFSGEDSENQMSVTTIINESGIDMEIITICSQLESLPAPAMDCLLSQLSISDAVRLRGCSKRTQEESVRLTPRFWRDRLLAGEAVEWVWDLDRQKAEKAGLSRDWEGVVREMRQMTVKPAWMSDGREESEAIGITNRRRVVKIVKEILEY